MCSGIQLDLSLLPWGFGILWYLSNRIPFSCPLRPFGTLDSAAPITDFALLPIGLPRSFPATLNTDATVGSLNFAA